MGLARRVTVAVILAGVWTLPAGAQTGRPRGSLPPFRSDEEALQAIRSLAEEKRREEEEAKRAKEAARRERELRLASTPPCAPTVTASRGITGGVDAVIHGSLRWSNGRPMPGTTVRVADHPLSAVTDSAGNYRIVVPADRLTFPRGLSVVAPGLGAEAPQHILTSVLPGDSAHIAFTLCQPTEPTEEKVFGIADAVDVFLRPDTYRRQHRADEGDIVKSVGDHLVVLRRGRLFTIAVNDGRLHHVSTIDAFPAGADSQSDWQNALVTFEDKVIVIGESPKRGGVEISVFRIDDQGRLHYGSTHHLRSEGHSNPYLIGRKLVLYSWVSIESEHVDPLRALPALRKWSPDVGHRDFQRIVSATRVYKAPRFDNDHEPGLNVVTTCDIATPELTCEAYAVWAPRGGVLSVSSRALYMWVNAFRFDSTPRPHSTVYRLALDGSAPSALNATGIPTDVSSVHEADGYLNMLLEHEWDSSAPTKDERRAVRLLRVPIRSFGDGTSAAPQSAYRSLPPPSRAHPQLTSRFIDDQLVYGSGTRRWAPEPTASSLFVVPLRGGPVLELSLPHGVDQIARIGENVLVAGADTSDLHLAVIRLGRRPRIEKRVRLADALGPESTYDVAYLPNGTASGVLGLSNGLKRHSYRDRADESASAIFLRNDGRRLVDLGQLSSSRAATLVDDKCKSDCYEDWFSGSRAIFHRGRIFALLGYELVEGAIDGDRVREIRRVSFAP